jgi:enoyl-CoA hydratase/carnithine racemase
MTYETLSYEREAGVATITLQRPEMRNAVNSVMNRELPEIWRHFEEDDEAVVAIVTGSGGLLYRSGSL